MIRIVKVVRKPENKETYHVEFEHEASYDVAKPIDLSNIIVPESFVSYESMEMWVKGYVAGLSSCGVEYRLSERFPLPMPEWFARITK